MSALTLRDELAELVVSGVTRRYLYQPADLNPADLPAQWAGYPSRTQERLTYTVYEPSYEATVYWAVRPIVQGDRNKQNTQVDIGQLMDDIYSKINELTLTGYHLIDYSLAAEPIDINGTLFDGIVMTVTAKED